MHNYFCLFNIIMIIILVNSFKSTDTLITIFTIILIIQREIIHCLFQNYAFSLYNHIWPHPITATPAPGVMKDTILAHQYYIFSLSASCTGVKKKIFKEIMHFHYMTIYDHTQSQEPLPQGS